MANTYWKSDTELCEIFGDAWAEDMDVSREAPKDACAIANEWLEDNGYTARVSDMRENESGDECDWLIDLS